MAKLLKTARMRKMLAAGKRKASSPPNDGMMIGLINRRLANGWHYQVEHVHDTRISSKPYIVVFAFPPRHRGSAPAPYFLWDEPPPPAGGDG